jgi:hypothetical protein
MVRGQLPTDGWYVGMAVLSLIVGIVGGSGVSDLFPGGSVGPLLVGTVVAASLFTVLVGIGMVGGRIILALIELAPEEASVDGTESRD